MEALGKKLCNAVRNGDVDLVQDCLHKGADLHYEDDLGRTPLHWAAVKGYTDVTKVLVEAGASLSAVDNEGQTPLHLAALMGHTEVTKVLVEAGASLSAVNKLDWTPLHLAASRGHTEVTKVLLEARASLSAVDYKDMTPLHKAAERGNTDVIKVLLEAGASLSAGDNKGMTPLHWVAVKGHTEVTKVLLEAGASLSAVDNKDWTPLHLAASRGHTEVTKVLLEAGASLSAVNNEDRTPLHLSERQGKTDVTKVLVEAVDKQKYMDKVDMSSSTDEIVAQFPMMGTHDEIKELLSKGTFISYENCVYLGGACNVGKSTLASILIGEEIPKEWISTDGLNIYFGRNGINLTTKEMVPLKLEQGSDGDVLSRVLCGQPDMRQAKPDTKNSEKVQPQDSDKRNIIQETHTQRKDITLSTSAAPNPTLVPGTGNDDVNKTDPLGQQSVQHSIIATIQEKIRKGTYKIEIAPSDLVDFGGQRSFDMTHQLFMRHKGTFVLMFNGKIYFKDDEQKEITKSILIHWVNSILSYCVDDDDFDDKDKDILPIILFCATHSDEFNQEDRKDRKEKLIHDLGEIFKNHKLQHRIIYNDIFFINGQEKNDPEINELKSKLVEVAFKQKSWGRRMPIAWVPLELQMSELRSDNMNIISKEELMTLNLRNEDLKLKDEQIEHFLNVQHSLGKLLYLDNQGLDHFIIVQPQSLVHILRSFITDEHFWPKDEKLKGILETLTITGQIPKANLFKLWSQEKFHKHMPNDYFKEFIIQVLVHLDILVEPKHYRQEQESTNHSYIVPCMVKCTLPDDLYVKSAEQMICLSYTLLKSSIPPALSFKLIGAAINMWPLKETSEGICLYHQAAILCIDGSNELHLLVEDGKVFVYLINKEKKGLIPPDIASTVQECLTLTMTKVLEFYHKSFGKSLSTFEVSKAFAIEVGEWCTSGGGCYISVPEVKKKTEWRCKNNRTHKTKCPRYWIYNKKQFKCDKKCSGLEKERLALYPEEKHFIRLAPFITLDECHSVVTELGMTPIFWDNIINTRKYDTPRKQKYFAFYHWRDLMEKQSSNCTLKDLSEAFNLAKVKDKHALCKLFMKNTTVDDIANSALQKIPEDDVLQDLSKKFADGALHLGVELGLPMATIEEILLKNEKSYFGQNRGVMEEWKRSKEVKPTILMLMKAFQHVDGKGVTFLAQKYGIKVKDHKNEAGEKMSDDGDGNL